MSLAIFLLGATAFATLAQEGRSGPQDAPVPPVTAPSSGTAAPDARAPDNEDMEALFKELQQTDGDGWRRAESDILRIWSRSGSAAMDLLYKRGEEAIDAGELTTAIGHLTALTDHAPDFASGWQMRAVAYYLDGKIGPAVSDLARVLVLEPRHFGALTQMGAMLEEVGDDDNALKAYRMSLDINPHQQEAVDAVKRLQKKLAGTDI